MAFVEYAQVLHFPILHYHPKYLRIPFANIDQLDRRVFFYYYVSGSEGHIYQSLTIIYPLDLLLTIFFPG